MHDAHAFLQNLALVLCAAAVTTVVFQRLRLPVVFGYLFAGMIVGPHVPIPLAADEAMVRTLSELGVILLMFSIGLEFRLGRVIQVGGTAGLAALAETSVMMGLGYLAGQLFGWTPLESLFTGAIVAISSTTIIAKAFAEHGVRGRLKDVVFGILIVEDLIAILLVAVLTAVAAGGGVTASELAATIVRLVTFLAALIGVGLLTVPRLVRAVLRLDRAETTLVVSVGICFAAALLALAFGYSVALGAFIAGSLVAESGQSETVERLVLPVRDLFVAIFFVSVGMLIDPRVVLEHWGAVVVLSLVVMAGKIVAVSAGAFLTGSGLRHSVQAGMSLAQIGEFSFIIAAVGLSFGATRDFLYPVAVAVSAITTLTTPWLIRAAGPVAAYVDRKLPKPLQTFVALYGSWIERLRTAPPAQDGGRSTVRRAVRIVTIDAVLLAGLVIGAALERDRVVALLTGATALSPSLAQVLVSLAAVAVALPLLVGLFRSTRFLGLLLATRALPASSHGRLDFAAAPRRALVTTLQLAILLLVVTPLLAVTQPFLPRFSWVGVLVLVAAVFGVVFWQSARNLQGHARAGAEVIAMALAKHMTDDVAHEELTQTMAHVAAVLPGLGEPVPLVLPSTSPAVGRSLKELDVRGLTGATILAITRAGDAGARVLVPTGAERLHAGDVLAIAGSQEAVEGAKAILAPIAPIPAPGGELQRSAVT